MNEGPKLAGFYCNVHGWVLDTVPSAFVMCKCGRSCKTSAGGARKRRTTQAGARGRSLQGTSR